MAWVMSSKTKKRSMGLGCAVGWRWRRPGLRAVTLAVEEPAPLAMSQWAEAEVRKTSFYLFWF